MTGLQRMMTALRREQPDRVPVWELIVNAPVIRALYGDISYADFVEKEDLDGITIFETGRIVERYDSATYRDEWGIVWRTDSPGIPYPIEGPIRSERDLDAYRAPDADADYRLESLERAVKRFKGERAVVFLGHDAFEFSHYLRGMDNLLLDYVENPGFAHRLARIVLDYKKRVMERAIEAGADIVLTGDDYAHRTAPITSPTHFREFVLPYLREMVDLATSRGVPFVKHTDGNVWSLMDDLVATGIAGLDPLEPIAGMDIGEVKRRYGDRIAVVGNVDCGDLLSRGTPDQVIAAVKETIAKAAVGGGHILASSNSIHPAVNAENYRAMVDAARMHGVYPLDPNMVDAYRTRNYIAQHA
jgi:uroporphyrinogen decarboxylase